MTGAPGQGNTSDYEQAEAVASLGRADQLTDVITVAFNDRTTDPDDPKFIYPDGPSGTQRIVKRGASLMGWSYSLDGGQSFDYGGRVSPPTGWSVIWGDPALATSGSGFDVYLAELAGSDDEFPDSGELVNTGPPLDGFCVAKSSDGLRRSPRMTRRCSREVDRPRIACRASDCARVPGAAAA